MREAIRAWALVTVTCLGYASNGAELPNAEAMESLKRGTACYKLLKWECAITEWQRCYEAFPSPVTLFNLAQAYRQAGDAERALMSYKLYLGDSPNGTYRGAAEEMIRKLEPLVEQARQSRKAPPVGAARPDSDKPSEPAQSTTEKQQDPRAAATNAAPATDATTSVHSEPDQVPRNDAKPIYKKPALWVGVVAALVVIGSVVGLAVAFTTPNNASPPTTGLGAMRFSF